MNCELSSLGWISVETTDDDNHKAHWNKSCVRDDFVSFDSNHQVAQFFMAASPGMVENWMEMCGMETAITLMEKLLMDKYCGGVYTDEQKINLREIMDMYGPIIAENMCVRTLLGVGCGCNDFKGNPAGTDEDD